MITQISYVSAGQIIVEGYAVPGTAALKVTVPGSGTSAAFNVTVNAAQVNPSAASRFLDQASFGPTAATVAHVQQIGYNAYLQEQFQAPPSVWQDAATPTTGLGPVQANFFYNAMNGNDQLRQRVAFALSEIWVISGQKINAAKAFVPYLRLLANDAFGNYYRVMQDMSLNPAMGFYLNMVNNDRPRPAVNQAPNENYARELMQLFTIGDVMLNPDGTQQTDSQGNVIPTYTQAMIADTARALTGWTYAPISGPPQWRAPTNYASPMVAIDDDHDTDSKTILRNVVLPAGNTAVQDFQAVLWTVFNHPNVGPFVSKQLIQHLVTGNPSPAYVQRVAAVFNNDGTGVRGNLQAVVQAILLDPEARAGDYPATLAPTAGHLSEPVLLITRFLRAVNASVPIDNTLGLAAAWMGEQVFYPANVFNFFSPYYALPSNGLLAPEFQIHSGSFAMNRVNFMFQMIFTGGYGVNVDLTSLVNAAGTPALLVDGLNLLMMHGQMPADMRQTILTAMNGTTGQQWQAYNALFLVAASSQYWIIA